MREGMVSNLEKDKQELNSKIVEIEIKRDSFKINEKAFRLKVEEKKKVELEKNELSKKREEKQKLNQEIEKSRLMMLTKEDSINYNLKSISQLKMEIDELQKQNFEETKLTNLEKQISILKNSKVGLNEQNVKISSEISALVLKNQDSELTKNKISKIEFCPTCLQDVGEVHKHNVVNKFESDIIENKKRIEILVQEKNELLGKLSEIESAVNLKEKELRDLQLLRIKIQGVQEKDKRLKELEKNTESLKKDVVFLSQQISLLKESVLELSKLDNLFELKEKEFTNALREERMAEVRVAELRTEIEVFADNINELNKKIKRTEQEKDKLNYLVSLENWLSEEFTPFIELIEKNVMTHLKSQFSQLFSEWFNMLVPESFNVRLDDNFTPIIEQQDYELDYAYMSGGERTAVALAYRLSLNQVINSMLSKIKTKDLVILDEPTDGFSDQQLDKMRSVLDELNVAQLIIVSHEQKIEDFVENIIRFKKENGISKKE
jgi:exonuclease SbcC